MMTKQLEEDSEPIYTVTRVASETESEETSRLGIALN
jgi:hypothetical protein